MPGTARDRPLDQYDQNSAAYHDMRRRLDPTYPIPKGFHIDPRSGQVLEDPTWWDRNQDKVSTALMLAPLAGGLGYGAATGTGVFGGAGAAGAAGAGGAGGAGAGGAGAGGATTIGGVTIPGFTGPEMIAPGITSTMAPSSFAAGGGGGLMSWLSNPSNWSNLLSTGGDVGNVLGNAARGAAEGRHLDALLNNQQDAIRTNQYGTEQNAQMNLGTLDVARQKFSEDARGSRGKQAAIGNLLQNIQDVSLNVPGIAKGNISGGLRPSALGAGGRAAGSELARQAMLKMMTPDTFTGGEILKPPPLTPIPQPSRLENAGATGGIVGNILRALGQWRRPRTSTTAQPPPVRG